MDARTAWLAMIGEAALKFMSAHGTCPLCRSYGHEPSCPLREEPTLVSPTIDVERSAAIERAHIIATAHGFLPVTWTRAGGAILDEVRTNEPRFELIANPNDDEAQKVSTDDLAEKLKTP